jgi:hypothetical protein
MDYVHIYSNTNLLELINMIYKKYPTIIFGGSFSLNCFKIINRHVHDLDLAIYKFDPKLKEVLKFLHPYKEKVNSNNNEDHSETPDEKAEEHSEIPLNKFIKVKKYTITDYAPSFGNKFVIPIKPGISVDLFILPEPVSYSTFKLEIDKPIKIRIQNPEKIMEAKKDYYDRYQIPKHKSDLDLYEKWLRTYGIENLKQIIGNL